MAVAVALTSAIWVLPTPTASARSPHCSRSAALKALGLSVTSHHATGGARFKVWSGKIPSWDGVPLAVDLTLPVSHGCKFPLMSLNSALGGNRHGYESNNIAGNPSVPWTYHWNNAWFAKSGVATLTFTPRGLGGSCGRYASHNGKRSGLPKACTRHHRHYWFQFADARYDVRDMQWIIGRLVDAHVVNPNRIAVGGGSLGAAVSWFAAILDNRIACGGKGWERSEYGHNPCKGKGSRLVRWVTPHGARPSIRAAVPQFSWASLSEVLLPNGRRSDGTPISPAGGRAQTPIGVPVQRWITQLKGIGAASGFFAPHSRDRASAWGRWYGELRRQINSVTAARTTSLGSDLRHAIAQWDRYKSPASSIYTPDARVPVVQVQGLDDSIIGSAPAQQMVDKVRKFASDYPVASVYGDIGHAPAANLPNTVRPIIDGLNRFIAYELKGRGNPPTFETDSYLTQCINPSAHPVDVQAANYAGLAPSSMQLTSTSSKTTQNTGGGTEAATSAAAGTTARCANLASQTDAGVAAWSWQTGSDTIVAGSPVVTASVRDSGPDAELNARIWDVTPSGTQYLISRGTYRLTLPAGSGDTTVEFQTSAAAFAVASGDTLKLELTGYDAPTYQPDAITNTTTIDSVNLVLPTTAKVAGGSGSAVNAAAGQSTTTQVAQFPGGGGTTPASYQATIDWGDGTSSTGTVASDAAKHFTVAGTHTWSAPGLYITHVRITTPSGLLIMFAGTATVS
jgi:hypothetical protein